MYRRFWYIGTGVVIVLVVLAIAPLTWASSFGRFQNQPASAQNLARVQPGALEQEVDPLAETQAANLVLSYAANFVCTESLQPGQYWYGTAAPLVYQKTNVLIHNPSAFPVTLYKKAVLAPVENFEQVEQGAAPGKWKRASLRPDYAFRIDCDDIAKLLTGDAGATFIGAYGTGVTVRGFVVIALGPQAVDGTLGRYSPLDVTAEYVRGSEVMKKDIHYQPWWRWWWWALPWRLGYPYERIVPIDPVQNIDCRGALYDALAEDIRDTDQAGPTGNALEAGRAMDPGDPRTLQAESKPALVALVGRCSKITPELASVDFVLVSNKGPTDADPRGGQAAQAGIYPWIPGRWYNLALVVPQNVDIDLDDLIRDWQRERWIEAGGSSSAVNNALQYYFPYWCGWGYWYWWWNSGNCISIGVGAGESIDVESITPVRVFMPQWPPATD